MRRGSGDRALALLVVIDQLLFSASSFGLQVGAALSSSLEEFGSFSLALLFILGQLYIARALASEALVVSGRADDQSLQRSLAAAGFVAVAAAGVAIAGGGLLGDRPLALATAITCLGLGAFDHSRYMAYSRRRPAVAASAEVLWMALFAVAVVALWSTGKQGPVPLLTVWGACAVVACLTVLAALRVAPALRGLVRWVGDHRSIVPGFLAEGVLLGVAPWLTFGVVAWVLGLADMGLLRKALIPISALMVVFIGVSTALMTRVSSIGWLGIRRALTAYAAMVVVVCGGVAILLVGVLSSPIETVLGEPVDVLIPLCLSLLPYAAIQGAVLAALAALKGIRRAWSAPATRIAAAAVEVSASAIGAAVAGLGGVVVGMTTGWAAALALVFRQLQGARAGMAGVTDSPTGPPTGPT